MQIPCTLHDIDTIYIAEISSAAIIYWNGNEIGRSGTPGKNRTLETGRIAPVYARLPDRGPGTLEIQVSNFHARAGGILGLSFGKEADFRTWRMRSLLAEALVLGALNAVGLFFLLLYVSRRQSISHLLFSILMIVCTVRSISSNSLLEEFWPGRDWTDVRLLLEYLTAVAIMPPLYFAVVYMLLEKDQNPRTFPGLQKLAARFIAAVYIPGGLILSLYFTLSGDASQYGRYQPYYVQFYLIPGLVFCLLFLLLAVAGGQRGAGFLLAGFAGVLGGTLLDAESTIRGQAGSLYVPAGLLIFAVGFSISVGMQMWSERNELSDFRRGQGRALGIARIRRARKEATDQTMILTATNSARRILLRLEKLLRVGAIKRDDALPLMGLVRSLTRRLERISARSPGLNLNVLDVSAYFAGQKTAHQMRIRVEGTGILWLADHLALDEAMRQIRDVEPDMEIVVRETFLTLNASERKARALTSIAESLHAAGAQVLNRNGNLRAVFAPAPGELAGESLAERHRQLLKNLARMNW
ncbi:MAG: hypothetical protein JNM27_12120 [Leptospirales bacterium]|nr:hypothetical protein [Leptospirales bacterium]